MPPSADYDRVAHVARVARVRAVVATAATVAAQQNCTAPYDRPQLVRQGLAHAQAVGSEAQFAAAFLARTSVAGSGAGDGDSNSDSDEAAAARAVDAYSDELVFGLLLPLRAIASCALAAEPLASAATSAGLAGWPQVYIVPPSPMTCADEEGSLNESGQRAATLLSALDPTALALLGGAGTGAGAGSSTPVAAAHNRVALPPAACAAFARFAAYLQPAGGADVYRLVWDDGAATVTTAASAHLLAFHAAVADMLRSSGAGRYVDAILAETGMEDLAADGQTHLEQLLQLRLDGWWDGGRRVGRDDDEEDDHSVWMEEAVFFEEGMSLSR